MEVSLRFRGSEDKQGMTSELQSEILRSTFVIGLPHLSVGSQSVWSQVKIVSILSVILSVFTNIGGASGICNSIPHNGQTI